MFSTRSLTRLSTLLLLVSTSCLAGGCALETDDEDPGEDSSAFATASGGRPWDDAREADLGAATDEPTARSNGSFTAANAAGAAAGDEAELRLLRGAPPETGFAAASRASGVDATRLGRASSAFPIVGAHLVNGQMYLVSRNLSPTRLVAFDLATQRVSAGGSVDIPQGVGAWGMASPNARTLYVGQYGAPGRPNLFRLDPATRPLAARGVAALDALYIWDLDAASDGKVYGVASRENGSNFLFDYDPARDRASELGGLEAGERLRSVAVNDSFIYYGGNTSAGASLRARNRATGATVRLFHTQLTNDQTVYTVKATRTMLAAGTSGPAGGRAALAVIDLQRNVPRFVRVGRASDAPLDRPQLIDAIAIAGTDVYFTARPSGRVYRYDSRSNTTRALGVPVARSETRGLFVYRGVLVGASAEGSVWTYRPSDGARRRFDVVRGGATPGGEQAQSIISDGRRVYVGGNFGVQARDLRSLSSYRFFVPGEAKDMAVAEGEVYMAMYPVGELWAHRPGSSTARHVALFPSGQNRPTVIRHASDRRALFIATTSDATGRGALLRYDLANGRLSSRLDPIGQSVTGMAYAGGVAYVGGGSPSNPTIGAFDGATLAPRWRLDGALREAGAITGMEVRGGTLYAFTSRGNMILVDVGARRVERVTRVSNGGGRMTLSGGRLYGVDGNNLFRFDLATGRATTLVSRLESQVWGFPCVASESNGDVYAIERDAILRVSP